MLTIRKKLLPTWYPLPGDHNGPAPEFLLAPLTPAAFIDCRNEVQLEDEGRVVMSGKAVTTALSESVRGWRNVVTETGEQADFSITELLALPVRVQERLANEILNRAVLWESERKN